MSQGLVSKIEIILVIYKDRFTKELFTEFKICLEAPRLCKSGPPWKTFKISFEVFWYAFMDQLVDE